ncbi:MAG: hypothetical protein PQJ58_12030 [Spirochaetales bacterium]|nr:hypothetical protein [Spirochaetales bacterium]
MEELNLNEQHMKHSVPAGTVLLKQGDASFAFTVLHTGMVEVLYNENYEQAGTTQELIENSLRIGLVKGEALIGITGIMEKGNSISMRTVSDCSVSSRPMKREELIGQIHKDSSLNYKLLRDLCTRIDSTIYLYTNYKYLWHKYASIADSLALGAPGSAGSVYDEKKREEASLEEYSAYLKAMIKEDERASLPEGWDYNLFLGKIQDNLRLYDDHDQIRVEDLIDNQQYIFLKRLIQKNDKILTALFSKDEPMNQYIFDFLGKVIQQLVESNIRIAGEIKTLMDKIYSDTGWAVQIISGSKNDDPKKKNFLHFLAKFSWRCRKDTMTLLGKDLFTEYKVFSALKRYQNFIDPEAESRKEGPSAAAVQSEEMKKRLAKYKGLLGKILDFSTLEDSFKTEFKDQMDRLLKAENKHDSDPEITKLRDSVSQKYWQLYEDCFLKVIASDLKGFVPGIMLHFGVIDERFISDEDLILIDECYAGNLFADDGIPVMTLPYFLEKVYKSEVAPSMTEMGDLFKTVLKNQQKLTKKEKQGVYLYKDTPEDRVRFEIRQIATELYKMLYGNKKKALPFLCSDTLTGSLKRNYIDPEDFAAAVMKYKSRDFSLFYREVLLKHELGSDFIQKEVVPHFVLYPVYGTRAVMWQEMEGNNKNTPGRVFFPLYFGEKLQETIGTQLAYFRWELQKSIAGYNWTDPVEGGLVGVYYNYIRFFKKNPNISPEAKTRLEEFIKKTKSDKDRFAREYTMWVEFEFEGKVRLNSYVRDIFYRFCPYPAEKRSVMAAKPDWKKMENKFQNRRQKDILKLKSRIIKFEKKKRPLPGDLQHFIEFLEM